MKHFVFAALTAVGLGLAAQDASAASFTGYETVGDPFYDGEAEFFYENSFFGGSIFDAPLFFLVDIAFASDLNSGFLTLLDFDTSVVLDGSLLDTMLSVDNDIDDDSFSILFDLSTGPTSFAIATFTGDLDGLGTTDFFTDGVPFAAGGLTITGARSTDATVIPLPAGILLLGTGLAGFGLVQARRKQKA